MPITQAFDPTTGAANGGGSGGGGGGGSLYKSSFTTVDLTDGTWQLFDPLGLVKSVTFDGSHNTVTWNATAYDATLRWFVSGTKNAPRWYKLQEVDGNQVTSMDYQVFQTVVDLDLTVDDFNQACGMVVMQNPETTAEATLKPTGAYAIKLVGGNPAWGTLQYTGTTTGYNAAADHAVVACLRGGNSLGSGAYQILSSTDDRVYNAGSRNSNIQSVDATPDNTYLAVIIGIRGTNDTVAQDDQQRFRFAYQTIVPDVGAVK